MRGLLVASVVLGLATTAAADRAPAKAKPKQKSIDISKVADDLEVFRDDTGRYYVWPRYDAKLDDAAVWVFYGDDKKLYQQRVIGYSRNADTLDWTVWAPRVRGIVYGRLGTVKRKAYAQCSADTNVDLTPVTLDEKKALFARATFLPPLWQRMPHLLARDEDGVYYYVDRMRQEHGGRGYRVFVGLKGAMKELPMKNVVQDSAGDIFATKSGDLRITTTDGKVFWKKGGKKVELIKLEPADNRYVIYRDLGIYGALGAICEDQ